MNFRGRKITAALLAGGALFSGAGIGSAIAANATQTDTSSSTTRTQSTQTQRGHHQANPAVTAAVKSLLGVDDAALKASKTAKQTLTQLAATKGVAKADLVTAIANALKASKPANAPTLTDAQLTDMATHIADHVPGQKDRGARGANDGMRAKVGAAVASTLGMTTAELQAAHKAGTSLATLASQKGVDKADLVSAVSSVLKANKPANAPALTDAQLTQLATDIVDGVHHGPGGHGPGGMQGQGRR